MEWYAVALILSLASSAQADCSSQCVTCAQQISNVDVPINSLACTLECEGVFSSTAELAKCAKALRYSDGQAGFGDEEENGQESAVSSNMVKRYGGFIKRINKNKIYAYPSPENAPLKSLPNKKYGNLPRKFWERDTPELSQDIQRGASAFDDDAEGYSDDSAPVGELVKRYGGFFRKLTPKRSDSADDNNNELGFQKRYGGFMRRIRPKLKWENQKRYGGFLRRHFKISVRSEEEPSSYDGSDL